jgi:hypothetical protein
MRLLVLLVRLLLGWVQSKLVEGINHIVFTEGMHLNN